MIDSTENLEKKLYGYWRRAFSLQGYGFAQFGKESRNLPPEKSVENMKKGADDNEINGFDRQQYLY